MTYNYLRAVTADAKEYIEENYTAEEIADMLLDRYNWECTLCDDMWTADSVTGNGSGSYTFSTYQAEEYICHNLDLLAEAVEEFGGVVDVLKNGAEACDVTIRCHLLSQAIAAALDEIEAETEVA